LHASARYHPAWVRYVGPIRGDIRLAVATVVVFSSDFLGAPLTFPAPPAQTRLESVEHSRSRRREPGLMIHEIARLAVAVFYSRHSEIKVVARRFREAASPGLARCEY